jgi:hypothetical protein
VDHSSDSPPLIPTPRHLRKRVFRGEIPDSLLVPGGIGPRPDRAASNPNLASRRTRAERKVFTGQPREATQYATKRRIALTFVVLVALAVPVLIAALIVAG